MASKEISLTFVHGRETKNTHVFNEVDAKGNVLEVADAVVGAIYVKKSAIGDAAPESITVNITVNAAAGKKKPAKKKAA